MDYDDASLVSLFSFRSDDCDLRLAQLCLQCEVVTCEARQWKHFTRNIYWIVRPNCWEDKNQGRQAIAEHAKEGRSVYETDDFLYYV